MQHKKHSVLIKSVPKNVAPSPASTEHWDKILHRMEGLDKTLKWLVRLAVGIALVALFTMFFLVDPNTMNHLTACTTG